MTTDMMSLQPNTDKGYGVYDGELKVVVCQFISVGIVCIIDVAVKSFEKAFAVAIPGDCLIWEW